MLRQTAKHTIAIGLVLTGLMSSPLWAQTRARSTSSHRFIPVGTAPRPSNFRTPEYERAVEDFNSLRELWRELRRSRARGSKLTEEISGSIFQPTLDPSLAEKLPLETQELMRQWSQNSVTDVAQQMGRELVEFNQQFRQRSGVPESTQQPNDISFDFSRDVIQRIEEARSAYVEQQMLVNSAFREADRQFKSKWPSERIPPREWLERVQPFIDSEILEQLAKVRDFQDGKLPAPPEIPESLLTNKPPPSLSERMIESVVRSVDQGGNELLKRAQRNNQGKKKLSWWKELRKDANASLKSWNKSITDRTESYAASSALTTADSTGNGDSAVGASAAETGDAPSAVGWLRVVAFGLVLAGIFYLYYRRTLRHYRPGNAGVWELTADSIQDRASLLQAVHRVAVKRLGSKSRYWHHRQFLPLLRDKLDSRYSEIDALYERARYAPDGHVISREELELVRHWYQQVQRKRVLQS